MSKGSEAANQPFLYWIEWNTVFPCEYRQWFFTFSKTPVEESLSEESLVMTACGNITINWILTAKTSLLCLLIELTNSLRIKTANWKFCKNLSS